MSNIIKWFLAGLITSLLNIIVTLILNPAYIWSLGIDSFILTFIVWFSVIVVVYTFVDTLSEGRIRSRKIVVLISALVFSATLILYNVYIYMIFQTHFSQWFLMIFDTLIRSLPLSLIGIGIVEIIFKKKGRKR